MNSVLKELNAVLESSLEGIPGEKMAWRPAGKWCAAEVLEHLYLTYTGTIKGFEKVLAAGNPLAGRPSTKQRARSFVVLGLSYLPGGRKAPKGTEPRGLPPEKVQQEITAKIAEMDEIITRCETRFGSGVRLLDHPVLGPLTAAQWRKFHLVHGRHHARQILSLRDRLPQS